MTDFAADNPAFQSRTPPAGPGRRTARKMGDTVLLRRWLGCWIDFLAMGAILAASMLFPGAAREPAVWIAILLVVAYFPVTEGRWGRTLGKLVAGTVVVDAEGRPPGYGRAIVRTLTRLIEVNPFFLGGIPAGLIAICTKHHQRLGDLLARTYVVPVKELGELKARTVTREQLEVFD
jgi:uncharacterized RDD family membrane protein YckC